MRLDAPWARMQALPWGLLLWASLVYAFLGCGITFEQLIAGIGSADVKGAYSRPH